MALLLDMLLGFCQNYFGFTFLANQYYAALFIVGMFVILAQVILLGFNIYLRHLAKRTTTQFDDLIFDQTKQPLFVFILIFGVRLALEHVGVIGSFTNLIDSALAMIFLYLVVRVTDVAIQTWGDVVAKKTDTPIDEILLPFLHKIVKAVFVIIGIIWLLHIWGVDITPYLAGAGIAGIILGLALQDSLKNILGGISLLLDKTYQVGDKVALENGEIGQISDIGLRSTKMVTYDNEVLYVPNGYMANSRVRNYTRPDPSVRVKVDFGVEYGSDVGHVQKVVLKVIDSIEGVKKEPVPAVNFLSMGDFALKFRATFWVETWGLEFPRKVEATEKIYNALNKAKIGIPFPTQTVLLSKAGRVSRSSRKSVQIFKVKE